MAIFKIQNKQLMKLLEEKEVLVQSGRTLSKDIQAIEEQIVKGKEEQKALMDAINPVDLIKEGDALQVKIEEKITLCRKKIGEEIFSQIVAKDNILFMVICELAKDGDLEIVGFINALNDVVEKIHTLKRANVPAELITKVKNLEIDKENLERSRNKVALKVQKVKDRSIPMVQKEMQGKMSEFEDMETAQIINGEIVVVVYDQVEEFKQKITANRRKEKGLA